MTVAKASDFDLQRGATKRKAAAEAREQEVEEQQSKPVDFYDPPEPSYLRPRVVGLDYEPTLL